MVEIRISICFCSRCCYQQREEAVNAYAEVNSVVLMMIEVKNDKERIGKVSKFRPVEGI